MKKFRFLYLLLIAAVAGFVPACTDSDDFTPGPAGNGAEVFFADAVDPSKTELFLDDNENKVAVTMKRVDATSALTVQLLSNITADGSQLGNTSLFSIPMSVTFAAGADTAVFNIDIARSQLEDGVTYQVSLLISGDENFTPYGASTITYSISAWPWEAIEANNGFGKYRDDWLGPFWNLRNVEVDVEILEHKTEKGVYLVYNMFEKVLTESFGGSLAAIEAAGYIRYTPTDIRIDTDPATGRAIIEEQFTGCHDLEEGYGDYSIATVEVGSIKDGVITFPAKGLVLILEDGRGAYANSNGLFRLVLPGYEAADYSVSVAYTGMLVNAAGNIASAQLEFSYGDDVTGIKYAIFAGNVVNQLDAAAAAVANGTAQGILEVEGFVQGAGKVANSAPISAGGNYTVVAVPLDKSGTPNAANAAATLFTFPGLGGGSVATPDIDLYLEFDLASNLFQNGSADTLGFVVESETIDDIEKLVYLCAPTSAFAQYGGPSIDLVEQVGTDMSQYIANIKQQGYIGLTFKEMDANVDYTCCVLATSVYGKKLLVWDTAMVPVGNTGGRGSESYDPNPGGGSGGGNQGGGNFGLGTVVGDTNGVALTTGTYLLSDTVSFSNGDLDSECAFIIKAADDTGMHFIVDGLCNVTGCDWNAIYNASKGTLTLDGSQNGYESDGVIFGNYVIVTDGTYYYSIDVTNDPNGSNWSEPCVFTVDTATGKLNGLNCYIEFAAYEQSVGGYNYLGSAAFYTPASKVQYVSASTTLGVKPACIPFSTVHKFASAKKNTIKNVKLASANSKQLNTAVNAQVVNAPLKLRSVSTSTQKCDSAQRKPARQQLNPIPFVSQLK